MTYPLDNVASSGLKSSLQRKYCVFISLLLSQQHCSVICGVSEVPRFDPELSHRTLIAVDNVN